METKSQPTWLTSGEAASRLGVHRSSLVRWLSDGTLNLDTWRTPAGQLRVSESSLNAYLADRGA